MRGGTILFHKLLSQKAPEEWKEKFRMSQPSLLKLSEELWPYIKGKSTSQRICGVLVWTVGNAMKTVVWTQIN